MGQKSMSLKDGVETAVRDIRRKTRKPLRKADREAYVEHWLSRISNRPPAMHEGES